MVDFFTLVRAGYFFDELPPSFQTVDLANLAVNRPHLLPANPAKQTSRIYQHDMGRVGISRRAMSIPNPEKFLCLAEFVSTNWPQMNQLANRSPLSRSLPIPNGHRAIYPQGKFSQLPVFRAQVRSKSRYVVITDIAKFYSSIYSHSIPWVLHGKAYAKKHRSQGILGNDFDRLIQNAQDGQTKGIPIGPDSSFLIAEMILSEVDLELTKQMPGLTGFRYMDDYELAFPSYSLAEEGLALLQSALGKLELQINFEKTVIAELPLPLNDTWITDLVYFEFRKTAVKQRTDIVRYFSIAFDLAKKDHNKPVLKYAIRRLRTLNIDTANWDLFQDLLLQVMAVEVGVIPAILELLLDRNSGKHQLSMALISDVLNQRIIDCGKVGLDSEVAWALWALINWHMLVTPEAAKVLSTIDDSTIAILALDARLRGLTPSGMDDALWQSHATEEDLHSEQWLLAYEAGRRGWISSSVDYIGKDPFFSALRGDAVSFYNENSPFRVVPASYGD